MWLLILTVLYLLYGTNYEEIDENFGVDHGTYAREGYKCANSTSPLYQVFTETDPIGVKYANIKCLGAFSSSSPNASSNDCIPFPNYKNSFDCNKTLSSNTYVLYGDGKVVAPWANSGDNSTIHTCNGPFMPQCKTLYDLNKFETIGSTTSNNNSFTGFACSYGNGTVPVQNNNNVLTCISNGDNVLKAETKPLCENILTKTISEASLTKCDKGKVGTVCTSLYNSLGLQSFAELGYSCFMVGNQYVIGKMLANPLGFQTASYDGINPIVADSGCNLINFPPTSELKPIMCPTYNSSNPLCQTVFSEYNLYPTTNPLTITQNNINQSEPLIITDTTSLYNLSTDNINALSQITGYDPNTTEGIKTGLEGLLTNYPIKVGCCSRANANDNSALNASVNVPLSPTSTNETLKKYNYQIKNLTIPANTCPANLYSGSATCNAFYDVNCENQLANYKKLNLPLSEFSSYSPSCSCYAPKQENEQQYSNNIPPKCYKDGCGTQTSYLDPVSRTNECNLTICSSIVNLNNVTAGQGVGLNNQITNSCGNFLPEINQNNANNPTIPPANNPTTNPTIPTTNPTIPPANPTTPSTNPTNNPTTPSTNPTTPPADNSTTPPADNSTTPPANTTSSSNSSTIAYVGIGFLVIICIVILLFISLMMR